MTQLTVIMCLNIAKLAEEARALVVYLLPLGAACVTSIKEKRLSTYCPYVNHHYLYFLGF